MSTPPAVEFDLQAYRERIGDTGPLSPTYEVLERLHLAHATQIPFENLDLHLGQPILIDLASLQTKLVAGRRGGYCFEQNTLFAAALRAVGFDVTCHAARVRYGATRILPRTHMLLRVATERGAYLADVGFGGGGLLLPIPLVDNAVSEQGVWKYKLVDEGPHWVLQSWGTEGWADLYAFTLEPLYPVDFEMGNHYTSTYPTSIFLKTVTVQRPALEARYSLRNRLYIEQTSGGAEERTLDDEQLLQVLEQTFGLSLPPGTRFRGLVDEG